MPASRRSRGGFTSMIHLSADGRCRPLSLIVTAEQGADCTQFVPALEKIRDPRLGPGRRRKKPAAVAADRGYSNGPCRDYLRRRGIRHTIAENAPHRARPSTWPDSTSPAPSSGLPGDPTTSLRAIT
ncbi:transposase [Streptomyces sp. CA-106131]|uniref:transposase n=1 Tax=Streptomyces sp. CA-106131 TaxID=3240045 RepID=UPI003D8BDDDC